MEPVPRKRRRRKGDPTPVVVKHLKLERRDGLASERLGGLQEST